MAKTRPSPAHSDGPAPNHVEPEVAEAPAPRLVETESGRPLSEVEASVVQIGTSVSAWRDPYHLVLTLSWPRFFIMALTITLVLNAAFAGLYVLVGGIEGGEPGSFADAFFFSVQTMSTVGYGQMHPVSRAANIVASVEAMLGMSGFALAAAVLFARVSRPTAHVLFSRVAVVSRHEGRPALMFRCANRRRNQLLEAGVLVTLVRNERTQEGAGMRRFHALALVHKQTPIFALPWTVIHRIDETSPLHGETPQSLADAEAEIVVVLSGIDDVFAQPVHARHSYVASDLRWGACFVDIVTRPRAGRLKVDLRRFHEVTEGPR